MKGRMNYDFCNFIQTIASLNRVNSMTIPNIETDKYFIMKDDVKPHNDLLKSCKFMVL